MKKYLFIFLGSISLFLGLCGLFTPGLPTTPLVLLTGTLYAKGSPRLYKKLEENKLTGRYLNRLKNGLSWKARILSISFMWCMVFFSAFVVFSSQPKMKYTMLGLGFIGTIAQLIALRKRSSKSETIILLDENMPNKQEEIKFN